MQVIGEAFIVTWLPATVRLSGPVLLASLGEVFAERAGVLNIGIEGSSCSAHWRAISPAIPRISYG